MAGSISRAANHLRKSGDTHISHFARMSFALARQKREYDAERLKAWSDRIGHNAIKAFKSQAVPVVSEWSTPARRTAELKGYFRSEHPDHPFFATVGTSLNLRETQVTKGLAHFLDRSGGLVAASFLRALMPFRDWPDRLESLQVHSETPTQKGFIDLLIKGKAGEQLFGAVVEIKFDHHAGYNPFNDYHRHASELVFGGRDENVAYVVLGRAPCARTKKLVADPRNPWQFVHWSAFLRRLDLALLDKAVDKGFVQLRRQIWEIV